MAITPKHYWVSPGQFYDADSSDYIHLIVGSGAPDGAADPQDSAAMGSLYFRDDASDDSPCLYIKIDDDGADDDWKALVFDDIASAFSFASTVTMETSSPIQFRDAGQRIYSPAANVGALDLAATGDTWRFGEVGTNYVVLNYRSELGLEGTARFEPMGAYQFFDDFDRYQTWVEAETPWIFNAGTDGSAADPAIASEEYGVATLTTGAGNGTVAEDGSQMVFHVPVQADSGGLVFETRLHIDTAITNVAVFAGFTDNTALEEPFTNAADVITSVATDACGFLYDTDATTDEWWVVAVDTDTDDTGNAATGTPPVADTYQVLRMEVDSDGATIRFYIDGTLEATFTGAAGVSPDVNLYATVIACGDGTLSKTVDVDYVWVAHNR